MGLRLYRKYCLLLGGIFIFGGFIFSSFSLLYNQQYGSSSSESKQHFLARDALNRHKVEQTFRKMQDSSALSNLSAVQSPPTINEYRKDFVKQMMLFAWNNYKVYAWGENELRPVSKIGHSASVFGRASLGATMVDALDTLHIMGLMDEFEDAREWVAKSFDMKQAVTDLSVFETNIRFVGGFLSAYALTSDKMFLGKARYVADLLLPAFNTPTGIPMALVNMRTGRSTNYGWASGGCSILSEYGSLELEFSYLSSLTGNSTYLEKASRVREVLAQVEKPDGLYPNYLNPRTGKFCMKNFITMRDISSRKKIEGDIMVDDLQGGKS